MIHFRPLPLMSLLATGAFVFLLMLGAWQLERAEWKRDLIAQWETVGEANSFQDGLCATQGAAFGPAIRAAVPLAGPELRYYALREGPGWLRLSAVRLRDCETGAPVFLLVERGFESLVGGTVSPTEGWRIVDMPPAPSFAAANDPEGNEWYTFDRAAMAAALGLETEALLPLWGRSADVTPSAFARTTPVVHLGYAATWFGLAATLIGVYLAFHIVRGRLRFVRGDKTV